MLLVSVIMGSQSDWPTMKQTVSVLQDFGISCEKRIVSAHRMPDQMFLYAEEAEKRGIQVIIAGAGGAAHLPGMVAAKTILPVIGVPIQTKFNDGLDSLLSIVQMPGGIPVATTAVGEAGAKNAAYLALSILALSDTKIKTKLADYRKNLTKKVTEEGNRFFDEE